jgi:hypothetical protein
MQELRFVAVSEDGRYAVLAVPGRSARFTLPIDERLRAVAQGQTSRLAQYEIEVESPLRPKEIQARIRAGETVEEIADAAGIAVERVRWFEGPVLAERAYVAEQAQAASVRRPGESTPGPRLGEITAERLTSVGADPDDVQWDARKRGDGNWQVLLTFTSGGRLHVAEWMFDPRRRHVIPVDDNAARMSLPGAELPIPAPPVQGEATVTRLAPRLRQEQPAAQRQAMPDTPAYPAAHVAAAASAYDTPHREMPSPHDLRPTAREIPAAHEPPVTPAAREMSTPAETPAPAAPPVAAAPVAAPAAPEPAVSAPAVTAVATAPPWAAPVVTAPPVIAPAQTPPVVTAPAEPTPIPTTPVEPAPAVAALAVPTLAEPVPATTAPAPAPAATAVAAPTETAPTLTPAAVALPVTLEPVTPEPAVAAPAAVTPAAVAATAEPARVTAPAAAPAAAAVAPAIAEPAASEPAAEPVIAVAPATAEAPAAVAPAAAEPPAAVVPAAAVAAPVAAVAPAAAVAAPVAEPPAPAPAPAPAPEAPAPAAAAASDAAATPGNEQSARPGRKNARGRRSSVPSWDEIMLGSARQRD